MIITIQGYEFTKIVKDATAKLVLFDGLSKYIVDTIRPTSTEELELYALPETTREWIPGRYSYQLLGIDGVIESGAFKVKANLLYSTEIDSYWQKALKAVEDRIAGKALDPANDISVGDKRISYYKFDELLRLRNFILTKISEEEEEEGDEEAASSPNDEKKILFQWRG